MKITGIIAEYNPLHNGHLYQIQKTKEEIASDYIVVVMSGSFVQRGAPAIIDKYTRAKMALMAGADLVLELPVYYSTSSAELFSMGAVTLLDKLGCISDLCFGSECGDISLINKIAQLTLDESAEYKSRLNEYLKLGNSYPMSSAMALKDSCADEALKYNLYDILNAPNNSLGITYVKSLKKRQSNIVPHTITRIGGDYNDDSLGVFSASSVRKHLEETGNLNAIANQLPDYTYESMMNAYHKSFPITENDFSQFIIYRLRSLKYEKDMLGLKASDANYLLSSFVDINESLSRRIDSSLNQFEDYRQFCSLLKSKHLTYTHVSRALIHILLDLKKSRLEQYIRNDYIYYARVLGFKKDSSYLLTKIKENSDIPLISKLADSDQLLRENGRQMLKADINAANLYEQISCLKFNHPFTAEYSKQIVRI